MKNIYLHNPKLSTWISNDNEPIMDNGSTWY